MLRLDETVRIGVFDAWQEVNDRLLTLLRDLSPDDWRKPTVHPSRDVKDLAAHLLHGSLRRVTSIRDRYRRPSAPIVTMHELIEFIQTDNRRFMTGMERVSPTIIVELIERYDPLVLDLLRNLDPDTDGLPVAWAGETRSRMWFDIAREYTEKWHHQQQLRDATGRESLYEAHLLEPVLQTFARGLPFAFRDHVSADDNLIVIRTTGPVECQWTLLRNYDGWTLWEGGTDGASTEITVPADVAWRVWTKSMDCEAARELIQVAGDRSAVDPLLQFVSIMA